MVRAVWKIFYLLYLDFYFTVVECGKFTYKKFELYTMPKKRKLNETTVTTVERSRTVVTLAKRVMHPRPVIEIKVGFPTAAFVVFLLNLLRTRPIRYKVSITMRYRVNFVRGVRNTSVKVSCGYRGVSVDTARSGVEKKVIVNYEI